MHIYTLALFAFLCGACSGLTSKSKKRTNEAPSQTNESENPEQASSTPGGDIYADLFMAEIKRQVVPSPFNDCIRGMLETISGEEISGWVIDTCELSKGNFAQLGGHGIIIYVDGGEGGGTSSNSEDVAFVPAAAKGALALPATPPASYIVARGHIERKVLYAGKEYVGKFGFKFPLGQYVRKGKLLRIDGVSASALSALFAKASHDKSVYSSVPSIPFDFDQSQTLPEIDVNFLKRIPQQKTPVATTVVPVHMRLVKRSNGTGNELWDVDFIKTLLLRANDVAKGRFSFSLQTVSDIKDDAQFAMNQWPLLAYWNPQINTRASGEITTYISNSTTTDAVGMSWIQVLYTPIIVIRGREDQYTSFEFLNNTALVFLHEMGHESNLNHSDGSNPVHTDAFDDPAWLDHVTEYYKELVKRQGEAPTCIQWNQDGVWKC